MAETSVRAALGAPRWRLMRQSLMESLLLSSAGALAGLVLASWGGRLVVSQLSTVTNRVYLNLALDGRVLAFTSGVTVGATLLFGILPAWRTSGVASVEALREQGHGSRADAHGTLSSGLVIAQVALSVAIIVAAGLFVRSFEKLATLPPDSTAAGSCS